jgi:hypothetical protein
MTTLYRSKLYPPVRDYEFGYWIFQVLSIEAMPKMIRSNVLKNLDKFPNLRKLGKYKVKIIKKTE